LQNQPEKEDMDANMILKSTKVSEIIQSKRRLVEVPYTASVADTLNALLANNILAVPVAAPPGQWIGAGGSMILESDKLTGSVRKQYIGMVSMLDILLHVAECAPGTDIEANLMSVPVSAIIGRSLEGLSLWSINPDTRVMDVMEPFSKGIHRALVPLESHMDHVGLELKESSPGYRMLTQMDIAQFFKLHSNELQSITTSSVGQLGAVNKGAFAVPAGMQVRNVVKWMRNASLNAVAIVDSSPDAEKGPMLMISQGRRLVGTFSATDLRGCPPRMLQTWLSLPVLEFVEKLSEAGKFTHGSAAAAALTSASLGSRPLVTCLMTSSLEEVISKVVDYHIHRIWVVDQEGLLIGLVSLTDILRAVHSKIVALEASDITG